MKDLSVEEHEFLDIDVALGNFNKVMNFTVKVYEVVQVNIGRPSHEFWRKNHVQAS